MLSGIFLRLSAKHLFHYVYVDQLADISSGSCQEAGRLFPSRAPPCSPRRLTRRRTRHLEQPRRRIGITPSTYLRMAAPRLHAVHADPDAISSRSSPAENAADRPDPDLIRNAQIEARLEYLLKHRWNQFLHDTGPKSPAVYTFSGNRIRIPTKPSKKPKTAKPKSLKSVNPK